MEKVYAISSGHYSDYSIQYMFKSKTKRDKVFESCNIRDAFTEDFELYDEKIDTGAIKEYYVTAWENEVKYTKDTSLDDIPPYHKEYIDYNEKTVHYYTKRITEKQYKEKDDKKWIKLFRDIKAHLDYLQDEGISPVDMNNGLNEKLGIT